MNTLNRYVLSAIIAGAVAFLPAVASAAILAGPITNPANGNSYYLLEEADWAASEVEAISLGGHLATINDAAEDAWVYSTFGTYGSVNRNLWIGLNDAVTEGTFVWASGEPVVYLNWDGGQPDDESGINGLSQDFTRIQPDSFWDDLNKPDFDSGQLAPINGVVEVVPEPSSLALLLLGAGAAGLFFRRRNRR